jgi:DNA helicase-2/ATP-dependent DNA helicase PcrA
MLFITSQNLGVHRMAIVITDSDISYAEKLLLPPGEVFNKERRDFIRCMESRDVVACPGSGKTTALLAKLLILAKKMPFEDGRGICVLTHTNVAIDEIKKNAGIAADSLFRYPNFFGTIHSFVGTYMAMPAYIDRFGHRQIRIDDDLYQLRATSVFRQGGLSQNGVIFSQVKGRITGKSIPEQLNIKKSFFIDLEFKFDNEYVSYCRGDTHKTVVKGSKDPSKSYLPIHQAKYGLLEAGHLRYRDIFPLAAYYLSKKQNLRNLFQKRFCFVFLDEMQDTDKNQSSVIDSIFSPNPEIIIQKIGDPNQAIFQNINSEGEWTPRNPLFFSDSHRYGENVSNLLKTVRFHTDISLLACHSVDSVCPQIITYEKKEEYLVIDAFAKLIQKFKIPPGKYCAIGWIKQDYSGSGKLCIASYYPKYCQLQKKPSIHFSNLISYMVYAIRVAKSEGLKRFFEIVIQGIAHALDVSAIKMQETNRMYTSSSVQTYWKQKNEKSFSDFRTVIIRKFTSAVDSTLTPIDLRDATTTTIATVWPIDNSPGNAFLTSNNIDLTTNVDLKESVNQCEFEGNIIVNVGTVHSVKGETHIATLYLETEYQKLTDSQRLMEFLKGSQPKGDLGKHLIQNLKIAHVGFSRPKNLLVFACQASNIYGHEDDLKKNGWEIHSVSNLLRK